MRKPFLIPKILAVSVIACAPASPSGTPQIADAGADGGLTCVTQPNPNFNEECPCGCTSGCPSFDCLRVQPSSDLCECVI